jgi:hypothetical protein
MVAIPSHRNTVKPSCVQVSSGHVVVVQACLIFYVVRATSASFGPGGDNIKFKTHTEELIKLYI